MILASLAIEKLCDHLPSGRLLLKQLKWAVGRPSEVILARFLAESWIPAKFSLSPATPPRRESTSGFASLIHREESNSRLCLAPCQKPIRGPTDAFQMWSSPFT